MQSSSIKSELTLHFEAKDVMVVLVQKCHSCLALTACPRPALTALRRAWASTQNGPLIRTSADGDAVVK